MAHPRGPEYGQSIPAAALLSEILSRSIREKGTGPQQAEHPGLHRKVGICP